MTADYTALCARLDEVSREKQQEAWSRIDGGADMSIGAALADEAASAIRELEARAREGAMQELASLGQAQEAYQAQLAPEATVATLAAQVEAMRGLLKEARDDIAEYVNADYPEEYRAQYPDMARRYTRDMELCRRIDAALTTENQTNG